MKEELDAYFANPFALEDLVAGTRFPLPDEPFAACWAEWVDEAGEDGVVPTLSRYLPQLRFPVRAGISHTDDYRRATRQGFDPADMEEATRLELDDPEAVRLELFLSLAGRVPVISLRGRQQFTAMARALTRRNEPVPIPESMGAQMVAGYNNWHRFNGLREAWRKTPPEERERSTWQQEFAHLSRHKELFQDRFILLSDGPYSAVPASAVGLDEETWRAKSLIIRRDHECAHYFTRRVFGSMRNNLLDELIADYAGIVAAEGRYRADWFLLFIGLEDFPRYRPGGRLDLYRGDPPLSDAAFGALHEVVVGAAKHLEAFDRLEGPGPRSPGRQALILAALAAQRLDELAAPGGVEALRSTLASLEERAI